LSRGSDRLVYDEAHRPVCYQANSSTCTTATATATYTYNGDGLRWTTTTNASTRYWVTGIDTMVLNDGGYKYVYGLGLAYAVDSLGNTLTQHTDGLGSVRAETDSSGNVVQTYGTDEFGIVDAALTSGTQPTPSSTPASRGTLRPGWSICEPGATTQRSDGSCRVIRCARAGQALAGGIGTSTWGIVR